LKSRKREMEIKVRAGFALQSNFLQSVQPGRFAYLIRKVLFLITEASLLNYKSLLFL
jgi:hypothetical protein